MTSIQVRRGTSTQWSTMNPVLLAGELGWDTTLKRFKMGDGLTGWNSLAFFLDAELNLKAPLNSPAFTGTVSGITKAMVGLGSVDNTADTAKPVSTAQQTALNGKANTSHSHSAADLTSGTVPDARLPARLGTVAATITDWNTVVTNGTYMAYNVPNAPTTGTWYLGDVIAHNSWYVTQTLHGFTTDSSSNTEVYRRSGNNVNSAISWGAWYKLQWSQAEQDARYQALIAAGTTAQYYRGDKTWQTLNAAAVGLGNVNNTADTAKPISTAQQTALNLKANSDSPTFTGTVSGITKAAVGLGNVDNTSDADKPVSFAQALALVEKIDVTEKAIANGVASLGSDGRVPAAQLPTVAGGAVNSMQGTYSAGRPAASSVSIGAVFYATDVFEQYRSDGTYWSVVGNGGNERGSATITALQSTTNGVAGPVDIVGMTTTFVAGERPVRIVLDCDMTNSSATNITTVQILLNDVQIFIVNSTASASTYIWQSFSKGIRKANLTPGGIYTARARLYVTGGTGFIGGATDNPSTLSVISL